MKVAKRKKKQDESARGTEGGHEHNEGEDGPCQKIDTQGAFQLCSCIAVRLQDAEAGDEDDGETHPESTIGRKGCSAESIAGFELPHARNHLGETSVEESEADDNVGNGNAKGTSIEEGEDEGGDGESAESKGSGIGNSDRRSSLNGQLVERSTAVEKVVLIDIDVSIVHAGHF